MKFTYLAFPLAILLMAGCNSEDTPSIIEKVEEPATQTEEVVETTETSTDDSNTETTAEEHAAAERTVTISDNNLFSGYKLINVDGGDLSGYVKQMSSSISDRVLGVQERTWTAYEGGG